MVYNLGKEPLLRLKEYIFTLSPSMGETRMRHMLIDELKQYDATIAVDHIGNVTATLEGMRPFTLALSAHIDTVGVQITNILPTGYLQFRSIGIMPHTLLGQPIVIISEQGDINGMIGFDPTSQYGQPKGLIFDDLWIDIGASSYDEALRKVAIGDLGVFAPRFQIIDDRLISGTSIDNKIGIFCIMEAVKSFRNSGLPINIEIVATSQEEIGLRGSMIATRNSKANACVVVDVDYATDTPASHENQLSRVWLGNGHGVHFKADNNEIMRSLLIELVRKRSKTVQKSVGRYIYGGTDATQMQVCHGGIPTANISIPNRYMHSPIECCAVSDVEQTIQTIIDLIEYFNEHIETSFSPK